MSFIARRELLKLDKIRQKPLKVTFNGFFVRVMRI
jgi:hypothetical protein